MATLRLMGAKRYSHLKINKGEVITNGQKIVVDDEKLVAELMDETYKDALNNEHYMFDDVTDAGDEPDEGAQQAPDEGKAPKRTASKRSASKGRTPRRPAVAA